MQGYIVNVDPQGRLGSHWITLCKPSSDDQEEDEEEVEDSVVFFYIKGTCSSYKNISMTQQCIPLQPVTRLVPQRLMSAPLPNQATWMGMMQQLQQRYGPKPKPPK